MLYNFPIETHLNNNNCDSFDILENVHFVQDTIHAGLKLRNRILKAGVVLPFGNRLVSVAHLKMLINEVPKDEHSLVMKDVCVEDKQNYRALQKLMHPKVSSALQRNVINSEATVMYLKICSNITSSFCELDLSPLERVKRIFHAVYTLRIWRKNLELSNGKFNANDNFVTKNAYECVELNAHNLVSLIKTFRDQQIEDLFIPVLMSSQPCEETFRTLRTFSTINYTKINFTLLEVLHIISRVELLNNIVYFELAGSQISLPRNKINDACVNTFKLPSDTEIEKAIRHAKHETIKGLMNFGMQICENDIDKAFVKRPDIFNPPRRRKRKHESESENDSDFDNDISVLSMHSSTKSYPHENSEIESSPFVRVNETVEDKTIKKKTYLWLLTHSAQKCSNDRTTRTRNPPAKKSCVRRLNFNAPKNTSTCLIENEQIKIGDWCIFNHNIQNDPLTESQMVLGNILAFQYINGKSHSQKRYTWDFAPTVFEEDDERKERGIEVLATWFEIDMDGNVSNTSDSFYINIESYKATVSNLPIINEKLSLFHYKSDLSKYF